MLAPKGSSFLYVKKSFQTNIDPLVISWGYEADFPSHSQFQDYHQFQGTRDFSAFLTTPACLKFLEDNRWSQQTKKSRAMIQHYYPILAKELNSDLICPLEGTFLGQMCSVPISTTNPLGLKSALYDEYKIEIPVVTFTKQIYLRMSLQPYNSEKDVEILIDALREIKQKTSLID
jgi:isopenicillin-N epimerase